MTVGDAAKLLASRRKIRAAVTAVRRSPAAFIPTSDPDPDPDLLDLVEAPFETPEDAHERLVRLEDRLLAREDRRSVFLTIYTKMTDEVRTGMDAGRFADAGWMARYLVRFANYYRRAFLRFERGKYGSVPDPWTVAFGTAVRGEALVIQDAFLGVNAHINYDLAFTLDDVGIDPDRAGKRADHVEINEILANLVDAQQRALAERYASGLDDVDRALGELDEVFTLFTLTEGREQAWRSAVVLTDAGWLPIEPYVRWVVSATATGAAYLVLSPSVEPEVEWRLRNVEADTDLESLLRW